MRLGLCGAAAFLFLSVPTIPAEAACFGELGCTDRKTFAAADLERLSCDTLWTVRNTIFHEKGYCFQTPRGRAAFPGKNCFTSKMDDIGLNRFERANVNAIARVEQSICSKSASRQPPEADSIETRGFERDRQETAPASPPPQPPAPPQPPRRDEDPSLPTGRGGTALPE